MIGIGLVLFCCVMFIHLGLGDTICRIIHFDFILFQCVKCITFWSELAYSILYVKLGVLESLSIAFAMSYLALWIDLILFKIACRYDVWYEKNEKEYNHAEEG